MRASCALPGYSLNERACGAYTGRQGSKTEGGPRDVSIPELLGSVHMWGCARDRHPTLIGIW